MTLLPDGSVLLAGGRRPSDLAVTGDTWVLDPVTGALHGVSAMNYARRDHHAILLPTAEVLVVGGLGTDGVVGTAEVFVPATPPMPTSIATPTPTPLPLGVYSSGTLDVPQTWAVDLGQRVVVLSGEAGADIWFRAATEGLRYLAPVSGAKAAYMGGNRPRKDGCAVAPLSTDEVLIKVPSPGFMCVS